MTTRVQFRIGFEYVTDTSKANDRQRFYAETDRIRNLMKTIVKHHLISEELKGKAHIEKWIVDDIAFEEGELDEEIARKENG